MGMGIGMDKNIVELKKKMYEAILNHGVSSKEALEISQELDILVSTKQKQIYSNYCRGSQNDNIKFSN